MSHLCGCYHISYLDASRTITQREYLPLLDSEAHTTILSATSQTVLKQTFTNPSFSENIKECIYTFPLYDGVSVVGFMCKIGSKTLHGLVKEKAKAKEIFDAAVAKGETAGLLTQSPEASDVFSTRLGNVPAGQSIIVEVTYIGELKHDDLEGIRFTIPTSIAPRYGSGPFSNTSSPYGSSSSLPTQNSGGIKITVDVNLPDGLSIKGVQSPSHPIAVTVGTLSTATQADPVMSKASATLSLGTAALEKDFVLIVQSKDTGTPKALLEIHPTIPHHRALMATLVPKFSLPPTRSEIVFVADRSGSMRGNIAMLISAMKVFLKSMPTGIRFNICSFGSHCTFLWPESKSYTSETLDESMKHISTFNANYGGTETFQAIQTTIERRLTDLPLEIILLTDGDIWSQAPLFAYINEQVERTQGNIRVFPLGIGNGVSHALIEGLARAGNGFSQTVQIGERLDKSVVRMLRGALSPHITNYTLEVKFDQEDDDFEVIEKVTDDMEMLDSETETVGLKQSATQPQATISLFDPGVDPNKGKMSMPDHDPDLPNVRYPKLLQAPHKIPSLFAFARTTVYLLMGPETTQRNPSSVILRATSSHGPLALKIPVEVLPEPGKTIHQLAARKASQDLEESRGWLFDAKVSDVPLKTRYPSRFEDLVHNEAVRLGETFQVANRWCSFVAVSSNDGEILAQNHGHAGEEEPEEMLGERYRSSNVTSLARKQKLSNRSFSFRRGPAPAAHTTMPLTASAAPAPVIHAKRRESPLAQAFGSFQPMISASTKKKTDVDVSYDTARVDALCAPISLRHGSYNSSYDEEELSSPNQTFPPPPKTNAEKVLALIDAQDFSGAWKPGNARVVQILGFLIPNAPRGVSEEVWLTMLVVRFLEEKMNEEEGTWGMVVEKARRYVGDNMHGGDLEALEKSARDVVAAN